MNNAQKGFTLIELMIVIAIIGILVSILLPSMVSARHRARLSGCETNLRNLAVVLQTYATNNDNLYPDDASPGLNILSTQGYLSTVIPKCPADDSDYVYNRASDGSSNYTIEHSSTQHGFLGLGTGFPKITGNGGLMEK